LFFRKFRKETPEPTNNDHFWREGEDIRGGMKGGNPGKSAGKKTITGTTFPGFFGEKGRKEEKQF